VQVTAKAEGKLGKLDKLDKLILAFDEFQRLVDSCPELPSILQELWDRSWRDSGRVMVILCGSFMGFMEREVLGEKSPLYGRRTAQILLRPFSFGEAVRFHPGYGPVDQALAYFVCGGIPLYLRYLDDVRSVEANIEACLLEKIPHFPNPKNATIRRRLFLKSKPKASIANVTVVDLETLLGT